MANLEQYRHPLSGKQVELDRVVKDLVELYAFEVGLHSGGRASFKEGVLTLAPEFAVTSAAMVIGGYTLLNTCEGKVLLSISEACQRELTTRYRCRAFSNEDTQTALTPLQVFELA
jgi:hypothetical protein